MRLGNDLLGVGRSRCRAFGRIAWEYGCEVHRRYGLQLNTLLYFTSEPDLGNVLTKNPKFIRQVSWDPRRSNAYLGVNNCHFFPLIHPQTSPIADETYHPICSVLPNDFLDGRQ